MAHGSFDGVLGLPAAEQRRLLVEGDPPERLWAAWALALALGADAVPVVERTMLLDGHDGLRRQLLVVTAGLQERSLLSTVAIHDRSAEVRSTACAYFLRTAPSKTDGNALAFAQDRLLSDTVAVREAILLEHEGGRFVLSQQILLALLGDADTRVRSLVVRCLCSNDGPSEIAVDALIQRLAEETDEDLIRQIFLAIPRQRYPTLFGALGSTVTGTVVRILLLAKQCHDALDWTDLRSLSGRTEPLVLLHMLRLLRNPLPEDAFRWAAHVFFLLSSRDSSGAPPAHHDEEARWRSFFLVRADLSPSRVRLLDGRTAAALKNALEVEAHELVESEDEDYDGEDRGESLREVRELIAYFEACEPMPG